MNRLVNRTLLVALSLAALAVVSGCDQTRHEVRERTITEAAAGGYVDKVAQLLDEGADVNARNEAGSTLLHLSARRGFTDTVALLLERGADVNAQDAEGLTALHWADTLAHTESADLLREHGGVE